MVQWTLTCVYPKHIQNLTIGMLQFHLRKSTWTCCVVLKNKKCTSSGPAHATTACCEHCTAPICKECAACIYDWKPSLPPAALSNDMMIYYAPTILYTENVTVMEMLCASVCITSMICFTLEKKHRGHRSMDECVQQNSHRMAARGNATSFPLPWQDLMQQLHDGESLEKTRSECKPSTHRSRVDSCCVNITEDFRWWWFREKYVAF